MENAASGTYADVNSVQAFEDESGNMIAAMNVTVHANQTLDENNSTVQILEDSVLVSVPVIEKGTADGKAGNYETIVISLGNREKFTADQKYKVIVNGETDEERMPFFTRGVDVGAGTSGRPKGYVRDLDLHSISAANDGGNTTLWIQLRSSFAVDEANVTAAFSSGTIHVQLPTNEEADNGYKSWRSVRINISGLTQYEIEKFYPVLINENEELRSGFIFEADNTIRIYPAYPESIIIGTDGTDVFVSTAVSTGIDPIYLIDDERIETSAHFDENKTYEIYIPVREQSPEDGTVVPALALIYDHTFSIGKLADLEDGLYKVRVNGVETSFEVIDRDLYHIKNYGSYF
ncbi:hypothetical protein [Methanimicrococcus hacksteinii]|uniref:hypothetical protein n=1 Tax=Methanimicrococcus hacksteinii TaxID=3028293 RepID=UPI00298F3653|nr:hypothetical protein [Methanimicrococcus sp. At1]